MEEIIFRVDWFTLRTRFKGPHSHDAIMAHEERRPSLNYSRQALRKATKFVEGDYTGINPRQFYRSLKRSLEEIQEGDDFKYSTYGSQESDLKIESEQVGEKTGRVKGRLMALSDPTEIGSGALEYRPYGPHGALLTVLGGLLFLGGLSGDQALLFVSLLMMGGGGYLYLQDETGEFIVEREDSIRALMTGEVSERTIEDDSETRTDIFANMSVIYSGDAFLSVASSDIDEMDWTFRRELRNQVKKWYNQVVEEEDQVVVDEGFLSALKSWANRDHQDDRRTITNLQRELNDNFEMRIEYSDILMDSLPQGTRKQVSEHQDNLLEELKELSDEMEVYVEREGLKEVSN